MRVYNFKDLETKNYLKNNSLNYDIVIIGSGFASYVISKKLSKFKKILIIEKGNFIKKNLLSNTIINKNNITLKNNTLNECVGGTSNSWSGNLCEYNDIEFIDKIKKKDEWPIKKEIVYFYKEAWKIMGVYFRSKQKHKILNNNLVIRKIITQHFPTRISSKFKSLKVDIILNANVEYVGEKNNPFITIQDNIFYFRKLILANGGIGSIKTIYESVNKNYLKLNISEKFIGNSYMNHPKFKIEEFLIPKINDGFINLYARNSYSFFGVSLNKQIQLKNNLNNTYFRLHPRFLEENIEQFKISNYLFTNKKQLLINLLKFNFKSKIFEYFFKDFNINSKLSLLKTFLNFKIYYFLLFFFGFIRLKVKSYDIEYFFELSCQNKNSIEFIKNIIETNISLSPKDKETFNTLHSESINHFKLRHSINNNLYNINIDNVKFVDASHHIGGLNYLNFTKEGFVDESCKINNSKNLYVCSSSLFPTAGSCNPTLTIVSLALKLAYHLK